MAGRKGQRSGGHNAKTTEQHKADGTYQKCRHEKRVDNAPAKGKPVKPSDLGSVESSVWDEVVSFLPETTTGRVDTIALREMCQWYGVYRKCIHIMQSDPLDRDARAGATACWDRFWRIAQDFGATPVSRARLQVPTEPQKSPAGSPMEDLHKLLESRN